MEVCKGIAWVEGKGAMTVPVEYAIAGEDVSVGPESRRTTIRKGTPLRIVRSDGLALQTIYLRGAPVGYNKHTDRREFAALALALVEVREEHAAEVVAAEFSRHSGLGSLAAESLLGRMAYGGAMKVAREEWEGPWDWRDVLRHVCETLQRAERVGKEDEALEALVMQGAWGGE